MDDIPELTIAQVAARLREKNFFVIDNNGRGRWKRSHVPGARNLNPHHFGPDDLPGDKSATLVFYCTGPG